MSSHPVVWFEIYVQDLARAKAFYGKVLGVSFTKIEAPADELAMEGFPMDAEAGGASGALVHHKDMPSGGNSTVVYFHTPDCAVEAARVADAGGTLVQDKMSIGEHGFVAIAKDPDGNLFGLHTPAS